MPRIKTKRDARERRKKRIRQKMEGTASKPRLAVFRSLTHIYAQAIDDREGKTLLSASSLEPEVRGKVKSAGNKDAAKQVGELIARKCKERGIETVVFDRSGYIYHGRIKALADAARAAGLKF